MTILKSGAMILGVFCAGCGGGAGLERLVAAPPGGSFGPNALAVTKNATTGLFDFSVDGTSLSLAPLATHNHGAFAHYQSNGSAQRAYAVQTDNALVGVAASDGANGFQGLNFQNLATTTLPANGTATYSGDYVGFWVKDGTLLDANTVFLVNGTVGIDANFTDDQISGSITNRQARGKVSNAPENQVALADITLITASIDVTGAFTGNASGGQIEGGGWQNLSGTHTGVIAGPFGGEVVGGVTISYQTTGTIDPNVTYTEIGGFITD